jgi:hypothetical protein
MKKTILYFLLFSLPAFVVAQSFKVSNIPIPKTYIQNLEPYECDEICMKEYLEKDMIFSFLSYADKKLQNKELDEVRMIHMAIFNLGANILGENLKIAMLLPHKKIGRYASSTTNSTLSYLLSKSHSFELKSYNIEDESIESIESAIKLLQEDGFSHIIAPMTQEGVLNTIIIDPKINIYFPTINKNDINTTSPNLYFGGIDYQAQSDKLLDEAVSPLVIFHDASEIGEKLASYEEKQFINKDTNISKIDYYDTTDNKVIKFSIPRRTTNLEKYLKDNEDLNNSSCFINTPIVKTGMIMSQLTLYDTNTTEITNLLSTQINYDPLLFSMTQYVDRKNMIIANSITEQNNVLIETNAILDNDILYDWINYTTTVGIDYFYHLLTGDLREYSIDIQNNQMIYDIELIRPGLSKFSPYIRPKPLPMIDDLTLEQPQD